MDSTFCVLLQCNLTVPWKEGTYSEQSVGWFVAIKFNQMLLVVSGHVVLSSHQATFTPTDSTC